MAVLIIDNYDSFTYNLFQQVGTLSGEEPIVHRNDAISLENVVQLSPTHIILSPGPGHPANARDFGICRAIITDYDPAIPVLGVCLGHQGIIAHLGGAVISAPSIVHGKVDTITHTEQGIFRDVETPLHVMRYHSLIGERSSLPPCLEIVAETSDGLVMAVRHRSRPLHGLQFHPESIGTPQGDQLIRSFLEL
jgi:anthranilate synthase component II